MRARRRVLLYCVDAGRAGEVGFVLRTRGYEVTVCDRMEALGDVLDGQPRFDGAVVLGSHERAVETLRGHESDVPVLLQLDRLTTAITQAHRVIPPGAGMDDLLEALRGLTARKRGPKTASKCRDCAGAPEPGHTLCGSCLAYRRDVAKGVCVDCRAELSAVGVRCAPCDAARGWTPGARSRGTRYAAGKAAVA